jgi:hypothetical protein
MVWVAIVSLRLGYDREICRMQINCLVCVEKMTLEIGTRRNKLNWYEGLGQLVDVDNKVVVGYRTKY